MTSPPRKTPTPRRLALSLSLLAVVLGLSVLIGWALDFSALKSVFPGLVTMKANTALGLLLSGAALALLCRESLSRRLRHAVAALAIATAVLGAVSLSEDLTGRDFQIDHLLVRDTATPVDASHAGRMSPATAFCFILLGMALAVGAFSKAGTTRQPPAHGPRRDGDDGGGPGRARIRFRCGPRLPLVETTPGMAIHTRRGIGEPGVRPHRPGAE